MAGLGGEVECYGAHRMGAMQDVSFDDLKEMYLSSPTDMQRSVEMVDVPVDGT